MCTAITYYADNHYFGRNLDLEYHYNEAVTITPRNYPFSFRQTDPINRHYAFIGIATVEENYPLYYDATNEFGLSIAGLNFPGNAVYYPLVSDKTNIAPFEFIPWILGTCKTVPEAIQRIKSTNIAAIHYNERFPLSPLHWIIADQKQSITLETTDIMHIYPNPMGVLTNNPPFPYHQHNIANYINLTRNEPNNRFAPNLDLQTFSRGMGAIGLPGDLSSPSRFVRAAFVKFNSVMGIGEEENVTQFFHILHSVEQQQGCVCFKEQFEQTVYSSCCNMDKGIYYYTTYENNRINAVHLQHENLEQSNLSIFPLVRKQEISNIN